MVIATKSTCSLCDCEYDVCEEGGINGAIGILPVNLCYICYNGMVEMVELLESNAQIECPECGHGIKIRVGVVDD